MVQLHQEAGCCRIAVADLRQCVVQMVSFFESRGPKNYRRERQVGQAGAERTLAEQQVFWFAGCLLQIILRVKRRILRK